MTSMLRLLDRTGDMASKHHAAACEHVGSGARPFGGLFEEKDVSADLAAARSALWPQGGGVRPGMDMKLHRPPQPAA